MMNNNNNNIARPIIPRFHSSSSSDDPSPPSSYHIEVSNLARKHVTQIIVTGQPDIEDGARGLLASMCVAVANQGGSITELHAAEALKEDGIHHSPPSPAAGEPQRTMIRDIITVVDYQTGTSFPDDQLQDLAEAVLEATRAPMEVVAAVEAEMKKKKTKKMTTDEPTQGRITVIPSSNRFKAL